MSTGVEPVAKVLEKPTAVALSDDALLCRIIWEEPDTTWPLCPAFKSQTPVSQHLRYLTLAWRGAVTQCYKAERKVIAATFSYRSNCNFQPPRENTSTLFAWLLQIFLLQNLDFCTPITFPEQCGSFLINPCFTSINFCPVRHLVVLGWAEKTRLNPSHVNTENLTQMAAHSPSSISSKPAVTQWHTQAPPNRVFLLFTNPPPTLPLCITCPCLLSEQEVIFRHLLLFPSLWATLRGVSYCSAAVRSTHLQGNLNFQTCTIIILPCQGNAYLVTCLLFLLFVLNDIFLVCSGGYKIAPRACEVSGVQGTCMFVWECLKTEGQVRCLSVCLFVCLSVCLFVYLSVFVLAIMTLVLVISIQLTGLAPSINV